MFFYFLFLFLFIFCVVLSCLVSFISLFVLFVWSTNHNFDAYYLFVFLTYKHNVIFRIIDMKYIIKSGSKFFYFILLISRPFFYHYLYVNSIIKKFRNSE